MISTLPGTLRESNFGHRTLDDLIFWRRIRIEMRWDKSPARLSTSQHGSGSDSYTCDRGVLLPSNLKMFMLRDDASIRFFFRLEIQNSQLNDIRSKVHRKRSSRCLMVVTPCAAVFYFLMLTRFRFQDWVPDAVSAIQGTRIVQVTQPNVGRLRLSHPQHRISNSCLSQLPTCICTA